jgi:hypothetical protein
MPPDHALRDQGSIVPTIYLYVSRTEALIEAALFLPFTFVFLVLGCHRLFTADARVTQRADHGSN